MGLTGGNGSGQFLLYTIYEGPRCCKILGKNTLCATDRPLQTFAPTDVCSASRFVLVGEKIIVITTIIQHKTATYYYYYY